MKAPIITIDGPAASGKTTIGELLAHHLGYIFLDTGAMYRAITWVAIARAVPVRDEAAITRLAEQVIIDIVAAEVDDGRLYTVLADGRDITWQIRRPEVDSQVSPVSAYPGVRRALTEQQQRIIRRGRIVAVGRDIGTVVAPDADLKIYLDASAEQRAWRRTRERLARGEQAEYEEVLAQMIRRDQIDSSRSTAPLRPAEDAVIVDSTSLSIEEVFERVVETICEWQQANCSHPGETAGV